MQHVGDTSSKEKKRERREEGGEERGAKSGIRKEVFCYVRLY
jgi:hypothetical protein